MTKPIPDGYNSVTPTLTVRGAANAIEFYKKDMTPEEISKAGQDAFKNMGK